MEAVDEPNEQEPAKRQRAGFRSKTHRLSSQVVRLIGLTIIRIFYRIRTVHPENIPPEGGVMLLPNHLSWGDAFFLTAACPRPVRFVMEGAFMKNPLIRAFCSLFNTVPISAGKPREALRIAAEAIKQGDVVCVYPEGQLSRTGTIQELKRGCEIIARLSGCPSVPVWSDGPWGSILSFERNRFFTKWPHRIPYDMRFAFAEALAPGDISLSVIRERILDASAATLADRVTRSKWPEPKTWANGYQLGQINALPRRQPFSVLPDDPFVEGLVGLAGFAAIFKSKATTDITAHWLGGDKLRQHITTSGPPPNESIFFDFSKEALTPIGGSGWIHCPCLAIDGIIISMSFPDPPQGHSGSPHQAGCKPQSRGILLPGFSYRESDGRIRVIGPALGNEGITLPSGSRIDDNGFVFMGRDEHPRSSENG